VRNLNRSFFYILIIIVILGLSCARKPISRQPNVILIVTDDQGSLDLNSYGSDDLITPNLDKLATRGVRFTQFYAGSALCSPSRASLLTGQTPQRAGLPQNAESRPQHFGKHGGLPDSAFTLAELFKGAQYRTGHFGKWHLGFSPGPNEQGFDRSVGFMGGCIDQWGHFNWGGAPWGVPPRRHDLYEDGKEVWRSGQHLGDIAVGEAISFIKEAPESPFFVYLAFALPHYPLQPYDRHKITYAHLPEPRRTYAAMITTIDDQIGRLLQAVDDLGITKETIVIFQSDHGHATDARANYGGGNSGPYRGAKSSLFEGGIRVPAIISWPDSLPQNVVRDQLAVSADWFATLADYCGIPLKPAQIDGRSLRSAIASAENSSPHSQWIWQLSSQVAIRQGAWKLLLHPRDTSDGTKKRRKLSGPFLVNLEDDISEKRNLAAQFPEKVTALTEVYQKWRSGLPSTPRKQD